MIARGLIFGTLTADDYSDEAAADPRIDRLREQMRLVEDESYSRDYLDPEKRTNSNSIRVHFEGGGSTPVSEVLYPLGHPRRRAEAMPLLREKLERSFRRQLSEERYESLLRIGFDQSALEQTPVTDFVDLLVL
jgi:2-methylcitrate dehydratase PrpD